MTNPEACIFKYNKGEASFAIRKPIGNLDGKELGVGASLWFAIDEKIEELQSRLTEKGVTLLGTINNTPFGKTLMAKDPDGYIITFWRQPKYLKKMTTIDGNNKIYTLINVFTVEPEKHRDLLEHLKEATINVFGSIPGYISTNLHSSDDKKTITNYAQWASKEEYLSIFKNQKVVKHLEKAASLAVGYSPVLYNEIWSHDNDK